MNSPIEELTTSADPHAFVLVIDDEGPIAEALAWIVEDAGYAVSTATSGQRALDLVKAGARPDLIFTDLMMPQMDGITLIGKLRDTLGTAMSPVVLITAADTRHIKEAVADAVLAKPFELDDVEALLSRFLAEA